MFSKAAILRPQTEKDILGAVAGIGAVAAAKAAGLPNGAILDIETDSAGDFDLPDDGEDIDIALVQINASAAYSTEKFKDLRVKHVFFVGPAIVPPTPEQAASTEWAEQESAILATIPLAALEGTNVPRRYHVFAEEGFASNMCSAAIWLLTKGFDVDADFVPSPLTMASGHGDVNFLITPKAFVYREAVKVAALRLGNGNVYKGIRVLFDGQGEKKMVKDVEAIAKLADEAVASVRSTAVVSKFGDLGGVVFVTDATSPLIKGRALAHFISEVNKVAGKPVYGFGLVWSFSSASDGSVTTVLTLVFAGDVDTNGVTVYPEIQRHLVALGPLAVTSSMQQNSYTYVYGKPILPTSWYRLEDVLVAPSVPVAPAPEEEKGEKVEEGEGEKVETE